MNKDETLRLALEALKTCQIDGDGWSGPDYWFDSEKVGKAIIAIRQALEQPEPEPVAWMDRDGDLYKKLPSDYWHPPHTPLYTSPPKREPLTDDHPLMVFAKECVLGAYQESELADAAQRAIGAAHGIKGEA